MAIPFIKTKKLKVSKYPDRYVIPKLITKMVIKNRSNEDVYLAFDGEKTDDAYILSQNETTEAISVKENTIHFCTKNENGAIHLLMWE